MSSHTHNQSPKKPPSPSKTSTPRKRTVLAPGMILKQSPGKTPRLLRSASHHNLERNGISTAGADDRQTDSVTEDSSSTEEDYSGDKQVLLRSFTKTTTAIEEFLVQAKTTLNHLKDFNANRRKDVKRVAGLAQTVEKLKKDVATYARDKKRLEQEMLGLCRDLELAQNGKDTLEEELNVVNDQILVLKELTDSLSRRVRHRIRT